MKKTILQILLDLIFVVLFNVIFFLGGGTNHPASVWISYAFIHAAYLMVIITPMLVKSDSALGLGMSVISISTVYFFIEFITGVIFIFAAMESVKLTLIIQILLFGIYAVILLVNLLANEKTNENEERHIEELKFVMETSAKLKFLMDNTKDKKVKTSLEQAYDIVHTSPVRSNIAVRPLELEVMNELANLNHLVMSESAEQAQDTINRIIFNVRERNTQLKLMN